MKRQWPQYDPARAFTQTRVAAAHEIDRYGHVNNVIYLSWLDECAWAHAEALGLGVDVAVAEGIGMAVRSVNLEYRAPILLGDEVTVRTWIVAGDGRFTGDRHFDILCKSATVLLGRISYVMLNLKTLKPTRMPQAYRDRLQLVMAMSA
jgi:acyl-CoA thioester hydrolase